MNNKDIQRIRTLAEKTAQLAALPVMEERRRSWKDLHSLRPTRPMLLIEPGTIFNYVSESELECGDAFLRGVELNLLEDIRHAEEIGDDIVIEPRLHMAWKQNLQGFGVDVRTIDAAARDSSRLAYVFNYPVKTPEDAKALVTRKFSVDKEATLKQKEMLEDILGGILEVRAGNYDHFNEMPGNFSWAGNYFFGLTWQLHRFIGMDQMMYWYYDYPDEMHRLLDYMMDDRKRMFTALESEGCVTPNTDNVMAGPRFYGYCDDLPAPRAECGGKLADCWAWAESQESTGVSGAMFQEFVLPRLAELAKLFGLVYYGCCEPVHDKLEAIQRSIPNLRAVSVSGWNDFGVIGEMLGDKYVYSRKPISAPLSGPTPDWDQAKTDLERTKRSARAGHLEVLYRDLYDINGDRSRLAKWVELARKVLD